MMPRLPLLLAALLALLLPQSGASSSIVARVPPKGWNSWDGYRRDLNEAELMKLAPQWAKLMLPSGYDTLTIDEFWYPNDGESASSLDPHGRAVVDEGKWPSAKGGVGFKAVADKIHALGLKLGIHVMHGVPKAAVPKTLGGDCPDKKIDALLAELVADGFPRAAKSTTAAAPAASAAAPAASAYEAPPDAAKAA